MKSLIKQSLFKIFYIKVERKSTNQKTKKVSKLPKKYKSWEFSLNSEKILEIDQIFFNTKQSLDLGIYLNEGCSTFSTTVRNLVKLRQSIIFYLRDILAQFVA